MASISIPTIIPTDNNEPVRVGEPPIDEVEKRPAKTRKRNTPIASTSASPKPKIEQPAVADDDSQATGRKAVVHGQTKADMVLKKLRSAKGVTIARLSEATGWQAHSVRGFLSAVVKKKLGLMLVSEIGKDGSRRYRIDQSAAQAK